MFIENVVSGTIARVHGGLLTLSRIRNILDTATSLLIYKQTMLPIIEQVSILVNSSTQRKISLKWQSVEKKTILIIEKRTGFISTTEMDKLLSKLHLKL